MKFQRQERETDTIETLKLPRPVNMVCLAKPTLTSCLSPSVPDRLSCSLNHWDLLSVLERPVSHLSGVPLLAAHSGFVGDRSSRRRCRVRVRSSRWPYNGLRGNRHSAGSPDAHTKTTIAAINFTSARIFWCQWHQQATPRAPVQPLREADRF